MVGRSTMQPAVLLAALLLFLTVWSPMAAFINREWDEVDHEWPVGGEKMFILGEAKEMVRTSGGEVRVVSGYRWKGDPNPMHIGFINMEPNTLFIPQYLDSSLVIFVRRGDAKVGYIYDDKMVVKRLKMGDIIRIPAGSAFYIVNLGKGQRLQLICSIDSSESLSWKPYESFFIGGGINPRSVISGFDMGTLTKAFNVTADVLGEILVGRSDGPIVYLAGDDTDQRKVMQSSLRNPWRSLSFYENEEAEQEKLGKKSSWTWRNVLNFVLRRNNEELNIKRKGAVHAPDSYNIYDRGPDFRNTYGYTIAIDKDDYKPLKQSDVTVYLVNLTAGSMLAPHVNPRATEYGIVLSGVGTIQIAYPNGTMAMNADVTEGDVFWIPRYFPFCQIASKSGPFVFFGFTTSARDNHPQFVIGASSILRSMLGPELAAAFGMREEDLRRLVMAQNESVILPSLPLPDRRKEKKRGEEDVAAL